MFSQFIPIPGAIQNQSSINTLKKRLEWGKAALTIIDARPRVLFNITHIIGSISMPMDEANDLTLASLELNRDIYIYAETDKQTAVTANELRQAGYQKVSELIGGLRAWKKANYPVVGWWTMPVEKDQITNQHNELTV
ncbi:rhodanese-like domain-containing protein [Waterburya agarophytonicola K14]|uniref:Rhodanese-like domain-containing protein n=1 Tax=Waterburya agarophytonicola KI4 TaxID=2874699 RepID=A0A964C0X4_9CYAN|nr:rhodanese-like domain-containing protein [Waterburya agarophytonicola]MCC0179615.1 rhodanese-like domain-containing protein [Waterburya agarophytonicola KI4]